MEPNSQLVNELTSQLPVRIDNPLLARELTFITTTQCNIECSYCYNFHNHRHLKLSPEIALGFLKAYLAHQNEEENDRYLQVTFTGGEPTLNPEPIFAVVDYLDNQNIDFVPLILTNGILKPSLLQELIDRKFLFQLSYDGGENTLRRTNSNKSTHNHIMETFHKLSEANAAIILRPTITRHNVHLMPDIVRLANEHNVCGIIFDTCDLAGNALKYEINRADSNDYVSYLFKALEIAKESTLDILVPEIMRYHNKGDYQQLPKLCLLPDGTLTTTTRYLSRQVKGIEKAIIGHYSLKNGLILNEENLRNMVNNMLGNIKKHCHDCDALLYCRGRNPNLQLFRESVLETKDDYRCAITREIYRTIATKHSHHSQ